MLILHACTSTCQLRYGDAFGLSPFVDTIAVFSPEAANSCCMQPDLSEGAGTSPEIPDPPEGLVLLTPVGTEAYTAGLPPQQPPWPG